MNEFQVGTQLQECESCAALRAEVNMLRARLARIETKAIAATDEIFGSWSGKAFDLWREVKGPGVDR